VDERENASAAAEDAPRGRERKEETTGILFFFFFSF